MIHLVLSGPRGKMVERVHCIGFTCPECQRLLDGQDPSWPTQPRLPRNRRPVVLMDDRLERYNLDRPEGMR